MFVPASEATFVSVVGSVCAGTVTWEFSPALGSGPTTGSVTQRFDGVCGLGVVGAVTSPPDAGEFHSLFGTGELTDTGGFSGTCELATVTVAGFSYTLVDSTLAVAERRSVSLAGVSDDAGANRLEPNTSCDVTSATGDWVVASAQVNES
jgi:hypothetical protein